MFTGSFRNIINNYEITGPIILTSQDCFKNLQEGKYLFISHPTELDNSDFIDQKTWTEWFYDSPSHFHKLWPLFQRQLFDSSVEIFEAIPIKAHIAKRFGVPGVKAAIIMGISADPDYEDYFEGIRLPKID